MLPHIFGILNLTSDSFSDGGLFLSEGAALKQAHKLVAAGASTVDLGAVSSNPAGTDVSIEVEMHRLEGIVSQLLAAGLSLSIDSFRTPVQRHFLHRGVDYINDISGFADPDFYPELADSRPGLIIMHNVHAGRARVEEIPPDSIEERLIQFFDHRIDALLKAGISRERMIIDPGMGHFLGSNPACSFRAIEALPVLRERYGLPILVGVSRKSFLGAVTDRPVQERGAASLAAELICWQRGVQCIRTHEPGPLVDACTVADRIADNL